jgi:hypothetical protein
MTKVVHHGQSGTPTAKIVRKHSAGTPPEYSRGSLQKLNQGNSGVYVHSQV